MEFCILCYEFLFHYVESKDISDIFSWDLCLSRDSGARENQSDFSIYFSLKESTQLKIRRILYILILRVCVRMLKDHPNEGCFSAQNKHHSLFHYWLLKLLDSVHALQTSLVQVSWLAVLMVLIYECKSYKTQRNYLSHATFIDGVIRRL